MKLLTLETEVPSRGPGLFKSTAQDLALKLPVALGFGVHVLGARGFGFRVGV